MGLADEVIPEPLGGAHKDPAKTSASLKDELIHRLRDLELLSSDERQARRDARYRAIGRFRSVPKDPAEASQEPRDVPQG